MKKVKAGIATLLGFPNAGKSTLFNVLVGEEVAIISPKPQTTWQVLKGHVVKEEIELVIYDTPGVQEGTKAINLAIARNLSHQVKNAKAGSEIILLVLDAAVFLKQDISRFESVLKKEGIKTPMYIHLLPILNKQELVKSESDREKIKKKASELANVLSQKALDPIWVSAKTGKGIEQVLTIMKPLLEDSSSGSLFDIETLTDVNVRTLVTEFIREQCYLQLGEEIPYSIGVTIENYDETDPKCVRMDAVLHVEKDSQKPIVIGKGATKIKSIGIKSRERIEKFLGIKIFLGLRVKVSEYWTRELKAVKRMGYDQF